MNPNILRENIPFYLLTISIIFVNIFLLDTLIPSSNMSNFYGYLPGDIYLNTQWVESTVCSEDVYKKMNVEDASQCR